MLSKVSHLSSKKKKGERERERERERIQVIKPAPKFKKSPPTKKGCWNTLYSCKRIKELTTFLIADTWGSNIRRPYNALNSHKYLAGSRSCKVKVLVHERSQPQVQNKTIL